MKKLYNPFKMYGSYVGMIICGIIYQIFTFYEIKTNQAMFCCWNNPLQIQITQYPIVWLIVGFLIGWGCHILIRIYRRRK
ncbi:MAG TPA: hypothetical protein VI911_02560 [Patescibacteria group bacterium]|nr:hypothetical protein [Patescibacteria group bacterium]